MIVGTDAIGRTNPVTEFNNAVARIFGASSEELIKNGYTNHAIAYSIVSYILDTASTIPWNVYSLSKSDGKKTLLPNHPLAERLYRPNPNQNGVEFRTQMLGELLLLGNSFAYAEKSSQTGSHTEWWVMPKNTKVVGGGWNQEVTGYRVPTAYGEDPYEKEKVVHLKRWNPENSRYGLSAILAGRKVLQSANSGLELRVKQYQNSGPAGLLYHDDTEAEPMSHEQQKSLYARIKRFFTDKSSFQTPYVSSKLGYLPLGLSPVDLDVLAALDSDKNQIADLFHFPAHLLNGANGSTFNNVSEASTSLYTKCIIPLLDCLKHALNDWVGKDYKDGVYIDYDLSGIAELQENKKELAEWLYMAYWIKINEKQRIMGVPVDETQDYYLVPAGMVRLDQLDELNAAGKVGLDKYAETEDESDEG